MPGESQIISLTNKQWAELETRLSDPARNLDLSDNQIAATNIDASPIIADRSPIPGEPGEPDIGMDITVHNPDDDTRGVTEEILQDIQDIAPDAPRRAFLDILLASAAASSPPPPPFPVYSDPERGIAISDYPNSKDNRDRMNNFATAHPPGGFTVTPEEKDKRVYTVTGGDPPLPPAAPGEEVVVEMPDASAGEDASILVYCNYTAANRDLAIQRVGAVAAAIGLDHARFVQIDGPIPPDPDGPALAIGPDGPPPPPPSVIMLDEPDRIGGTQLRPEAIDGFLALVKNNANYFIDPEDGVPSQNAGQNDTFYPIYEDVPGAGDPVHVATLCVKEVPDPDGRRRFGIVGKKPNLVLTDMAYEGDPHDPAKDDMRQAEAIAKLVRAANGPYADERVAPPAMPEPYLEGHPGPADRNAAEAFRKLIETSSKPEFINSADGSRKYTVMERRPTEGKGIRVKARPAQWVIKETETGDTLATITQEDQPVTLYMNGAKAEALEALIVANNNERLPKAVAKFPPPSKTGLPALYSADAIRAAGKAIDAVPGFTARQTQEEKRRGRGDKEVITQPEQYTVFSGTQPVMTMTGPSEQGPAVTLYLDDPTVYPVAAITHIFEAEIVRVNEAYRDRPVASPVAPSEEGLPLLFNEEAIKAAAAAIEKETAVYSGYKAERTQTQETKKRGKEFIITRPVQWTVRDDKNNPVLIMTGPSDQKAATTLYRTGIADAIRDDFGAKIDAAKVAYEPKTEVSPPELAGEYTQFWHPEMASQLALVVNGQSPQVYEADPVPITVRDNPESRLFHRGTHQEITVRNKTTKKAVIRVEWDDPKDPVVVKYLKGDADDKEADLEKLLNEAKTKWESSHQEATQQHQGQGGGGDNAASPTRREQRQARKERGEPSPLRRRAHRKWEEEQARQQQNSGSSEPLSTTAKAGLAAAGLVATAGTLGWVAKTGQDKEDARTPQGQQPKHRRGLAFWGSITTAVGAVVAASYAIYKHNQNSR